MKKYLHNNWEWKLAGEHVNGKFLLLWREDFRGHSGNAALVKDIPPEAKGHCWWALRKLVKISNRMEENE